MHEIGIVDDGERWTQWVKTTHTTHLLMKSILR